LRRQSSFPPPRSAWSIPSRSIQQTTVSDRIDKIGKLHNEKNFFRMSELHLPAKYVSLVCIVQVGNSGLQKWNSNALRRIRRPFAALLLQRSRYPTVLPHFSRAVRIDDRLLNPVLGFSALSGMTFTSGFRIK